MALDKSPHNASSKKSHKRKRDLDGSSAPPLTPTPTKKSKKTQSLAPTPTEPEESHKKKKRSKSLIENDGQEKSPQKKSNIPSKSDRAVSPADNDAERTSKAKTKKGKRKSSGDDTSMPIGDTAALMELSASDDEPQDSPKDSSVKVQKDKFSGILSKFERSRKVKEANVSRGHEAAQEESTIPTAEPVVAQGLEPLPQPEAAPEQEQKPTYSSLPPWLANPLKTPSDERTKFSNLGIEGSLLKILEGNGYKEAFPVQSAVIPLLLKGAKHHSGDLCISAATGSGKTLSYVLPLVTALEQTPAPRMRGLIVVPTRELVKQAREACELCAAGSGLRVASAVGNVAMKDEQRSLMRTDQVYGPEIFQNRQDSELTDQDWTNFSLQDYVSDVGDQGDCLPGYVHKAQPNVDILICTPGRLVDHIRYTKGFTLKHLEWLVIDEADRLLNESFQEWVDVVMNSLDCRKSSDALGYSGKFLADMGLPIRTKEPRKVILSATMTRDVTKLNSLRLLNPKLVLVGSSESVEENEEEMAVDRADEQFTLPSTLQEHSISVGDGSQKPLYLLRLLLSHIHVGDKKKTKEYAAAASESGTSSSDETSSDDTSSDESDDSDSETSSSGGSSEASSSDESNSDSSEDESSSSDESTSSDDSMSEDEDSKSAGATATPSPTTVLIFTKSSESASRLSRLLSLLEPSLASQIGTIIKSNKSSASRKTLTAYRRGKISIIFATDRASRGLDLPSLSHVVNYDVPTSVTTYVHRVGRTARAEKDGSAWTLVAHREGRWFMNQIGKNSNGKITRSTKVDRVNVTLADMKDTKTRYSAALDILEKEVKTGTTVKSTKVRS
ncbi:ATP-dependent RNA helicase dbp6 [Aspergillus nanangensis]|uniref:ATP-dependent RNA helicase n=1 Tax=Aspergillus nanangensis TaxID=2582783 RepID=A0AAD4CIZ4_ASPNN|nr:ATP-dependent RNA helicase dbp6 [Aspergillus nanangensis]